MKITRKILFSAIVLTVLSLIGTLLVNKHMLSSNLVRLHVVANSDSSEDQTVKLLVRDAVIRALEGDLYDLSDVSEVKAYLQNRIPELETVANEALKAAGSKDTAEITLSREAFPVRQYETFRLPSGVYDSLKVKIGSGEGKNWWCVVFPSFCIGAVSEDIQSSAVSAGFSDSLTRTLRGDEGYELSFFFLDCLGKLENIFHFH